MEGISHRWNKNFKDIPLGQDKSGSPTHATGGQVHNIPTCKTGVEIGGKGILQRSLFNGGENIRLNTKEKKWL